MQTRIRNGQASKSPRKCAPSPSKASPRRAKHWTASWGPPGARPRPWGRQPIEFRLGAKDLAQKALSSAEQNLRTTLDYAERLVRAKDLQEAAQVQSEYVRTQVEAMQAQMKEFGSAAQSPMGRASDQAGTTDKTKGRGKA